MADKIFQVELPIRATEGYWVRAKTKKEAMEKIREGRCHEVPEYGSIFSNPDIEVEPLGIMEGGDTYWSKMKAHEVEQ